MLLHAAQTAFVHTGPFEVVCIGKGICMRLVDPNARMMDMALKKSVDSLAVPFGESLERRNRLSAIGGARIEQTMGDFMPDGHIIPFFRADDVKTPSSHLFECIKKALFSRCERIEFSIIEWIEDVAGDVEPLPIFMVGEPAGLFAFLGVFYIPVPDLLLCEYLSPEFRVLVMFLKAKECQRHAPLRPELDVEDAFYDLVDFHQIEGA